MINFPACHNRLNLPKGFNFSFTSTGGEAGLWYKGKLICYIRYNGDVYMTETGRFTEGELQTEILRLCTLVKLEG